MDLSELHKELKQLNELRMESYMRREVLRIFNNAAGAFFMKYPGDAAPEEVRRFFYRYAVSSAKRKSTKEKYYITDKDLPSYPEIEVSPQFFNKMLSSVLATLKMMPVHLKTVDAKQKYFSKWFSELSVELENGLQSAFTESVEGIRKYLVQYFVMSDFKNKGIRQGKTIEALKHDKDEIYKRAERENLLSDASIMITYQNLRDTVTAHPGTYVIQDLKLRANQKPTNKQGKEVFLDRSSLGTETIIQNFLDVFSKMSNTSKDKIIQYMDVNCSVMPSSQLIEAGEGVEAIEQMNRLKHQSNTPPEPQELYSERDWKNRCGLAHFQEQPWTRSELSEAVPLLHKKHVNLLMKKMMQDVQRDFNID